MDAETSSLYEHASGGFLGTLAYWAGSPTQTVRSYTSAQASLAEMYGSIPGFSLTPVGKAFRAAARVMKLCAEDQPKPELGINFVNVNGNSIAVTEQVALESAFSSLIQLRKNIADQGPKVLLIPPMSGHFFTLLRGTAEAMAQDCDVHIPDWHDASDIPLEAGAFDLSTFINEIKSMARHLAKDGSAVHIVAVCQPTVAALVATSELAKEGLDIASLTLMAGPVDTRINPTKINNAVFEVEPEWIDQNLFAPVDYRLAGRGRLVLPKMVQLGNFMAPNMEKHIKSMQKLYEALYSGAEETANKAIKFYKEYFAVMNLPAEFIKETIEKVFRDAQLAKGTLTYRNEENIERLVNLRNIKKTLLLTVEGGKDDICGLGQTQAAHDLCIGIPDSMKHHHLESSVGHYGVFEGSKWRNNVYPAVKSAIMTAQATHDRAAPHRKIAGPKQVRLALIS